MSLGRPAWKGVREAIQKNLLRTTTFDPNLFLVDINAVTLVFPVQIGDYTDFYSSKNHAYNVGVMFRGPENALQPNWTHLPVGYHGRSSSVVLSGTPFVRPNGQVKTNDPLPKFQPCGKLDFELEIGFFVGAPTNQLGTSIDVAKAEDSIFGLVLLNDWSARDIQAWEYVPLGPFTAKNCMTSISPWIVTLEALEPFRVNLPAQDPTPLPYLQDPKLGSYNIELFVDIAPQNGDYLTVTSSNLKYLYWSLAQQLAHHTVTGCNMRSGDLCGTGTISGTQPGEFGSLLEVTWNGKNSFKLSNGEERTFLQDFDSVRMRGVCQGQGYKIGFGEVSGQILPAKK